MCSTNLSRQYGYSYSGVGLGCWEPSKQSSQVNLPGSMASWADIYQPIEATFPSQFVAAEATETIAQYPQHPEELTAGTEATTEPDQSVADVEYGVGSSTEFELPYSVEVGERIKQLIIAKNSTAARQFIPRDQSILSAYKARPTARAIKENNLAVEKRRKPGPRTEVHWCRYQARLVGGEWEYSDKPCYMLEGCNTGFSSRDIAIRHLKEHHFEMHIPRTSTKKARVLIGSDVHEANRVANRTKRK
jgi:hypothetical protein